MRQAVIVRGFDGVSGRIGAVRVSIPPNPTGLVKRHDTNHILIVTVSDAQVRGQVVVTPAGMESSHFQVNQADVVEIGEGE